jgi:hypothetical protein
MSIAEFSIDIKVYAYDAIPIWFVYYSCESPHNVGYFMGACAAHKLPDTLASGWPVNTVQHRRVEFRISALYQGENWFNISDLTLFAPRPDVLIRISVNIPKSLKANSATLKRITTPPVPVHNSQSSCRWTPHNFDSWETSLDKTEYVVLTCETSIKFDNKNRGSKVACQKSKILPKYKTVTTLEEGHFLGYNDG